MKVLRSSLAVLFILAFPDTGFAQGGGPAIVGEGVIAPAGTPGVMIMFDYVGTGSTVTGGRFDLVLVGASAAEIPVTGLSCKPPFSCPASLPGTFVFVDPGGGEVPDVDDAVAAMVDFVSAPFGIYELAIQNEHYEDAAANPVAPGGSVNGQMIVSAAPLVSVVNVQPPALTLTASFNLGFAAAPITISSAGGPGDLPLTTDCTLGPVTGAGGIDIDVPAFSGTLAPGASVTVDSRCSGTALGSATATYTCTPATPGKINDRALITCDVINVIAVPNPVPGSNVELNIGPVARGATASASVAFSEVTNGLAGFDVSCAVDDDGGGAFAIAGATSAQVPPGGSRSITVNGTAAVLDPQPAGRMLCTYSNGALGTVTVALGIILAPEIVPAVTRRGLIIIGLLLIGFGAWNVHRRRPTA